MIMPFWVSQGQSLQLSFRTCGGQRTVICPSVPCQGSLAVLCIDGISLFGGFGGTSSIDRELSIRKRHSVVNVSGIAATAFAIVRVSDS
jgi:hypothetical protein